MKFAFLTFSFFFISCFCFAQIDGRWTGILDVQGTLLTLVFTIHAEDGMYTATMDSPDQGATGIPIEKTTFSNDTLNLSAPSLKLSYRGVLDKKTGLISGIFSQAGMEIPLNLSQGEVKKSGGDRPQTPPEPYPYYTEEITFNNPSSGITLAGTLTLPDTLRPYPVVILITGSGPQNRDEEILGHKPFLVLADHLTRKGIGVLRYDDRGVGKSTGNFNSSTSLDFASDVEAAIDYLKTRKETNAEKIGLIGHSEGGMIAPMVAAKSNDVAFIILLAGPGIPISDLMALQTQKSAEIEGADEELIRTNLLVFNRLSKLICDNQKLSNAALSELLTTELTGIFDTLPPAMKPPGEEDIKRLIAAQANQLSGNWYRFFIAYDPQPVLRKVTCPVLAVNGSLDVQVTATENLAGINRSLEKGRCKNFRTIELAGLNHLFQEAKTGAVSEYAKIEQTLSTKLLDEMDAWLLEIIQD
ncbi:MAG: alpha/beta hydrolase [Bacteroidetes bacterium]|nr:alpha/beta hydrolase [Bacteroidota bacterium]